MSVNINPTMGGDTARDFANDVILPPRAFPPTVQERPLDNRRTGAKRKAADHGAQGSEARFRIRYFCRHGRA
ncbi:MAG: hypothetical protein HY985_16970 [Magnetospirillum sp.]|nr:hypothetical protein [Magnetospirillum sp.]